MLFRNKPEDIMIVDIGDGNCFMVPREVSTYIDSLKDENFELMKSKQSLLPLTMQTALYTFPRKRLTVCSA